MEGGEEVVIAQNVVSNCTYQHTFHNLMDAGAINFPEDFKRGLKSISYKTNCCKINLVLNGIPHFRCLQSQFSAAKDFDQELSVARSTMHNTLISGENMQSLHDAYIDAERGEIPSKPIIQMLMPSLTDGTLVPENSQDMVALLFVQYTPY